MSAPALTTTRLVSLERQGEPSDDSIMSIKIETEKKRPRNKSPILNLIKLCASLCGQTITLYGLLKSSRIIISKLNLPKQGAQMCLLGFIYAYTVNKTFGFFKYHWTIMLLIQTISNMIVNKIPKNSRLSKTNTAVITGVAMLYFCVYKIKYGSKSYGYFANTCYFKGKFIEHSIKLSKYYNNIQSDPENAKCCDLDEGHQNKSCPRFLLNKAVFFGKNVFKWYFKFYLCLYAIFTLKSKGMKILSKQNAFQVLKKSLKSALGSTWNNGFLCLTLNCLLPCITEKIFDKTKLSLNKHKVFVVLCYLPIMQRIALLFEPESRHSQLSIFFIAESIKWIINEYQGIDLINDKGKQNILQKNQHLMFGVYVFLQMVLFVQNGKKANGVASKMIQSVLT